MQGIGLGKRVEGPIGTTGMGRQGGQAHLGGHVAAEGAQQGSQPLGIPPPKVAPLSCRFIGRSRRHEQKSGPLLGHAGLAAGLRALDHHRSGRSQAGVQLGIRDAGVHVRGGSQSPCRGCQCRNYQISNARKSDLPIPETVEGGAHGVNLTHPHGDREPAPPARYGPAVVDG